MKSHTKRTLLIYWRSVLKYRIAFCVSVASIVCAALLSVTIPIFFKSFFDLLAGGGQRDVVAKGLISILMIIAVIEMIQWALWRIGTFTTSHFQSQIMADLMNQCYAYLQRHSFGFFDNSFVGSLVKRIKWFANAFEDISDRVMWNLIPLTTNITFIVIVLASRNASLAVIVIGWMALFIAVNTIFTAFKMRYDLERTKIETESTGFLADTMTNHGTVRLFNGYEREVSAFAAITDTVRRLRKLTWNLDNIFEAGQGFLVVVLEIGIFYIAIGLWQRGILTLGDFVLIQAYLIQIFMRVWDFGRMMRHIYERLADASEMTEILNTQHEIRDARDAKVLAVTEGKIEFIDVDFFYHKTRNILKRFNLTIAPREHVALIGPSGAGKTTVVKVLLRMHDIAGGKILIDGQRITQVTQESLWQGASLVPQDPVLFHRSLMENIRYGKPDATDAEVIEAAKSANCHEFISSFPDGYATFVGERGVKLSGGERQRVAIARAILRNAPILVLDEATSSLDSESERLIQEALATLMRGKTVIVIAHRLSTIKKMDRIVVMDGGRVVEEGTHDSLTKQKTSLYKKLWQLQAGGFIV